MAEAEQHEDINDQEGGRPERSAASEDGDGARDGSETDGFSSLGLPAFIVETLDDLGYRHPTAVQRQVIPPMLSGRDVIAQSQTGSGKTAAFALPILANIQRHDRSVQALVLTPTRELAIQVAESFQRYGSLMKGVDVLPIYGGQDYEQQFRALNRGVQIVVGTPGRVIDHIRRGTLELSELQCLVLDEADEMLNMGFLEDVEFVLGETPQERQTTLFSATMPEPIRKIASRYLVDPMRVTIQRKQITAESIRQRAVIVPPKAKTDALARFLEVEKTDGVIVFTRTKDTAVRLAEKLIRYGYEAAALNGDMPQHVRERVVDRLKSGRLNVLVATDVAARGLDVQRISHVFNFDLPHDSESYIHRIGRTGRAGRDGEAIIFLAPAQRRKLKLIERATKKSIEVVKVPSAEEINSRRIERFKERVATVAEQSDLTFFKQLIEQTVEQKQVPIDVVAAALAEIAQHGRPFLITDRHRAEPGDDESTDKKSRRRDRSDTDGRPRRDRHGPPAPGMVRYRLEVGRNDGVAPRNIVGAVANEAGIEGRMIGPIKIYPRFSTVDLPEGMPKDVFKALQRTWVSGKQLRIRLDGGRPEKGRKGEPHAGRVRVKKKKSAAKNASQSGSADRRSRKGSKNRR